MEDTNATPPRRRQAGSWFQEMLVQLDRLLKSEPVQEVRKPVVDALARRYGSRALDPARALDLSARVERTLPSVIAVCESELRALNGWHGWGKRDNPVFLRLSREKLAAVAAELDAMLGDFQDLAQTPAPDTPLSAPAASPPVPAAGLAQPPDRRDGPRASSIEADRRGLADRLRMVYQYTLAALREIQTDIRDQRATNLVGARAALRELRVVADFVREAQLHV